MKFSEVSKYIDIDQQYSKILDDFDIKGIAYDSRKVEKDFLFVAIKGYKTDGHDYIDSAINNGACAVLIQEEKLKDLNDKALKKIIPVENTRSALSLCAKSFYNDPDTKLKIVGVTGTNGKTTISYMVKEIVEQAGQKCGVIGTIAYYIDKTKVKAPNTTPESLDLYKLLNDMVEAECSLCVMEVSSHALFLNRVEGLDFDAAIFTNLSEDHLDFHKDMNDYLNAKLLILNSLKRSSKKETIILLNHDSHVFNSFKEGALNQNLNYKTYGLNEACDYFAKDIEININSNEFKVNFDDNQIDLKLSMLGEFNIYNSLGVFGVMKFLGYSIEDIKNGLEKVSVPGRFQQIETKLPFTVIIDYAHTDDALINVLNTIRGLNPKRIINVFGCGGDRETGKRYLMGEVSTRLADLTILTSDNPRTEDPERILDMLEEGAKKCSGKYLRIVDRKTAIGEALYEAKTGDIVLIAGKGHEDYQILKDRTIHFDDTEIATEFLSKIEENR